jgi:primosomal protein N' (replication factor Y)
VRARALGVPVVLGSATPSLESLHNAQSGRYAHLRLRHRAGNAKAPHVRVLDVRKRPLHAGLGEDALLAIRGALDAGGQVLVFRNRRGYAPVLLCHDCGWSAHCPRCSTPDKPTPMTVHAHGRRLQCHHCGYRKPSPLACPDCASLGLQPQGNGTERIEAELQARFDDVPVLRIDRGSTGHRDALQQHFDDLGEKPGILVGTQMLAKGHDLPNLTLVVVVGIDEGLFSADFRSSEKLAQLLVQVAGRAGRADKPGTVLLQTHHPSIRCCRSWSTAATTPSPRANWGCARPPVSRRSRTLPCCAPRRSTPIRRCSSCTWRRLCFATCPWTSRSGPLPAPMPRRAGYQRAQLILSATQRRDLHVALEAMLPVLHAAPDARKVRWSLDVDPVELY